jgi:hypothetical protein
MKPAYLFKVWVSTIISTPLLFLLLTLITSADKSLDSGASSFLVFSVLYGIVFSTPTLVLGYLLFFKLEKTIHTPRKLKAILLACVLFCMAITILILFGRDSYNTTEYFGGLTFTILYGISILGYGLFYKIH